MHTRLYTALALLILPLCSLAQGVQKPTDFKSLVALVIGMINTLVTIVIVLTVLVFMWGVIKGWIINGGSEEGVESGKHYATVGIIVLAIMVSIWGILYVLQNSFFGG
jgi:hypothetical protein